MPKTVVAAVTCLAFLPLACGPGESENQAPIAQISVDDNVVDVDEEVFLDGSDSSDPNGDTLIHRWTLSTPSGSASALNKRRGPNVSFVPDVDGEYTVELVVDDGLAESSPAAVVISAREADGNQPPTADAGSDITAEPQQEVTLDGTNSSDPDGDSLTYNWTIDSEPTDATASLDDPTSSEPTFTPGVSGTWVFELEVVDPEGETDTDMVVVEVVQVNPNDPPVAEAGDPQTVEVGTQVTLDGSASSDPNGDTLSFQWAIDSSPADSTAALSDADQSTAILTPDVAGEYVLSLTVGDGRDTDMDMVTVTAEPPLPCLIIGEVYEGASFEKAVEVFNCGDSALDVSEFGFCLVQNADTTCSRELIFSGTLAAGATRVVCHPQFVSGGPQPDFCDASDLVANFNGDDRMFVFEDTDASGTYTSDDTIVDAFGEIANQPSSKPWEDADYRRCNFEQFDGQSGFDDTVYYEKVSIGDTSDLSVAPTEGCP
jgi:hypothetical protein